MTQDVLVFGVTCGTCTKLCSLGTCGGAEGRGGEEACGCCGGAALVEETCGEAVDVIEGGGRTKVAETVSGGRPGIFNGVVIVWAGGTGIPGISTGGLTTPDGDGCCRGEDTVDVGITGVGVTSGGAELTPEGAAGVTGVKTAEAGVA